MNNKAKILIVGIGNTIRGDDGIGAYVCSVIEKRALSGVTTLQTHQLHIELLDEFLQYDYILLVDATAEIKPVILQSLIAEKGSPVSSSHHVNANLLVSLASQLYQKELSILLCAVSGNCFEMGEQLSITAKQNADRAVECICEWISTTLS